MFNMHVKSIWEVKWLAEGVNTLSFKQKENPATTTPCQLRKYKVNLRSFDVLLSQNMFIHFQGQSKTRSF